MFFHLNNLPSVSLLSPSGRTCCNVASVSSATSQRADLHCVHAWCAVDQTAKNRRVVACTLTADQWEPSKFCQPIRAEEVDNKIWGTQTIVSDHIWQIHSWFSVATDGQTEAGLHILVQLLQACLETTSLILFVLSHTLQVSDALLLWPGTSACIHLHRSLRPAQPFQGQAYPCLLLNILRLIQNNSHLPDLDQVGGKISGGDHFKEAEWGVGETCVVEHFQ